MFPVSMIKSHHTRIRHNILKHFSFWDYFEGLLIYENIFSSSHSSKVTRFIKAAALLNNNFFISELTTVACKQTFTFPYLYVTHQEKNVESKKCMVFSFFHFKTLKNMICIQFLVFSCIAMYPTQSFLSSPLWEWRDQVDVLKAKKFKPTLFFHVCSWTAANTNRDSYD